MDEQPYIPERFFDRFDQNLSDKQQLQMLEQCEKRLREIEHNLEQDIDLPPADVEIIHEYTRHESPLLRKFAVRVLCERGPIDWNDLERFVLDPDKEVRVAAMFGMELSYFYAARLCESDKRRAVAFLGKALEDYEESYTSVTLWVLIRKGPEWREAVWSEIQRLWDLDNPEITDILVCGVLEDMIYHGNKDMKQMARKLTRRL